MQNKILSLIASGTLLTNFFSVSSCSFITTDSNSVVYDLRDYTFKANIDLIKTENCKRVTTTEILTEILPMVIIDLEKKAKTNAITKDDFSIKFFKYEGGEELKNIDLSENSENIYIKVVANPSSFFLTNSSYYIKLTLPMESPYDLSNFYENDLETNILKIKEDQSYYDGMEKYLSVVFMGSFSKYIKFVNTEIVNNEFVIEMYYFDLIKEQLILLDPFNFPLIFTKFFNLYVRVVAKSNCTFLINETEEVKTFMKDKNRFFTGLYFNMQFE